MQDGKHLRGPASVWGGLGLTVACVCLAAAPARAMSDLLIEGEELDPAARPVFLVTEIVVEDGVAIDKNAARDALANRFGRMKDKIEVRSLAELKTTLDQSALQQMIGSDQPDLALAGVQDYVAVDRLVFGRIFRVAGVTEVQVRIFNTREATTEIGLSRRLKADAPPALVLTLLDTLADGLLAYVIDTYTDAKPSAAFDKLASKKLGGTPSAAQAPVVASTPYGTLSTVGGFVAGAGIGTVAAGSLALGLGSLDEADSTTALAITGVGAGLAVVGAGLIVVDLLVE